jgi:hypothetical protein
MLAILRAAIRETTEGRLTWEADPEVTDTFLAPLDGAILRVDSVDGDGFRPYRLAVARSDEAQVPLESLNQRTGSEPWDPYSQPELEDLWYAARRVALDIEPVLDSVLTQLGGPAPVSAVEPEAQPRQDSSPNGGQDPWANQGEDPWAPKNS